MYPMRADLFHADGQTDMTKLLVAFRKFAILSKNDQMRHEPKMSSTLQIEAAYPFRNPGTHLQDDVVRRPCPQNVMPCDVCVTVHH